MAREKITLSRAEIQMTFEQTILTMTGKLQHNTQTHSLNTYHKEPNYESNDSTTSLKDRLPL
jgi:hypothetical protein